MTNMQPLPLLAVGVLLTTPPGLPDRLLCGATAGDPPVAALEVGLWLAGGACWTAVVGRDVAGTALVGGGAGTDETWETWETCPPEPDT
jgi:hypothetical protein